MSKKMMLLALAVAALLAVPSAASAQEIHFNVPANTTFTGTGPAGFLTAVNEPKISSTGVTASGKFTSSTTGEVNLTFAGSTAELLGIKGSCNTVNDNTGIITSNGVFHLITIENASKEKKPAILVTPTTTTIICLGFSKVEVTGPGIIGTITSPTCASPGPTNKMTVKFEVEGSKQKHLTYTSSTFDLSADTEKNEPPNETISTATAALSGEATLESATAGTLECT